jgi:hypothetical protein
MNLHHVMVCKFWKHCRNLENIRNKMDTLTAQNVSTIVEGGISTKQKLHIKENNSN